MQLKFIAFAVYSFPYKAITITAVLALLWKASSFSSHYLSLVRLLWPSEPKSSDGYGPLCYGIRKSRNTLRLVLPTSTKVNRIFLDGLGLGSYTSFATTCAAVLATPLYPL